MSVAGQAASFDSRSRHRPATPHVLPNGQPVIVKRNLNPLRVVSADRAPLAYAIGVAVAVTAAHEVLDVAHLAVPFAPIGMLGAAVAIFTAFRINAANARWAEARVQWATIQNGCRVLTRQLLAATTNAVATGAATPQAAASYRREMAGRLIAYAYSLAARLRGTREPVAAERSWPDDVEGPPTPLTRRTCSCSRSPCE